MNSHGGLLGRKVELIILNDQSPPNLVVTNYQTLFGKDDVDLAFGPVLLAAQRPGLGGRGEVRHGVRGRAGGAPSFEHPGRPG